MSQQAHGGSRGEDVVPVGQGNDFPTGEDPDRDRRALQEQYCDPVVREPFIAALAGYYGTGV
jgi:hypothetical protein